MEVGVFDYFLNTDKYFLFSINIIVMRRKI